MNLTGLLDNCDGHVKGELAVMPEVEDVTAFDPTTETPPITARRWLRVIDVVAVVADLKSSTKLGLNKYAQSTASIYEAALHPVVDIFHEFGAGWIPIQGDCIIGLFWDEMAVERAICASITVKTFSLRHLVERLTKKWPENLPETGFKVGVATTLLLVKRVGRPQTPDQALVWPGKALNYAVKAVVADADLDTMELLPEAHTSIPATARVGEFVEQLGRSMSTFHPQHRHRALRDPDPTRPLSWRRRGHPFHPR